MASPSDNPLKRLISEIHRRSLWQVLGIYAVASWAVLQVVDTLVGTLGLPEWFPPLALALLLVGLPVVLATAFVQEGGPGHDGGDSDVAAPATPSGAASSLFTWRNAILGSVTAMLLLFGLAGAYVLFSGTDGLIGPEPLGAEGAAAAIAILPFEVSSEDFAEYREGMVNLLEQNLDGTGGFRTINSRTVLARWDEQVPEGSRPDLEAMLRVAASTGARFGVLGSLVRAGAVVRLNADVYDLDDGSKVGDADAVGAPQEMLALLDELTAGVTRELLASTSSPMGSQAPLASITTNSLPALEAYLEGERLLRLADFLEAESALGRAVEQDSTFALAWARFYVAASWVTGSSEAARTQTIRYMDRLSPREAVIVRASVVDFPHADPTGLVRLQEHLRRAPDDAEAWGWLGELHYHYPENFPSAPREQVVDYFTRAAQYDPGFAPYLNHLIDLALGEGDFEQARSLMQRYRTRGSAGSYMRAWEASMDVLSDDPADRERGIEAARSLTAPQNAGGGDGWPSTRFPGRVADLLREVGRPTELSRILRQAGRWREASVLDWEPRAEALEDRPSCDARGCLPPESIWPLQSSNLWSSLYGLGDPDAVHSAVAARSCTDALDCFELAEAEVVHAAHDGHAPLALAALEEMEVRLAQLGPDDITLGGRADFERRLRSARLWNELQSGNADGALATGRNLLGTQPVYVPWLAMAAEEAGDLEFAETLFRGLLWSWERVWATYRLAGLVEAQGRVDEALELYRTLAGMWESADGDFSPAVEMREALSRLSRR